MTSNVRETMMSSLGGVYLMIGGATNDPTIQISYQE